MYHGRILGGYPGRISATRPSSGDPRREGADKVFVGYMYGNPAASTGGCTPTSDMPFLVADGDGNIRKPRDVPNVNSPTSPTRRGSRSFM